MDTAATAAAVLRMALVGWPRLTEKVWIELLACGWAAMQDREGPARDGGAGVGGNEGEGTWGDGVAGIWWGRGR